MSRSNTRMRLVSLILCLAVVQAQYLDVKELMKDTLEAIQGLPRSQNSTERPVVPDRKNNNDILNLLKLPADIVKRLAQDVGYSEPKKAPLAASQPTKEVDAASEMRSFRTWEDALEEDRKRIEDVRRETPTMADQKAESDIFNIAKLISNTGQAIRAATTTTTTTTSAPEVATDVLYKPVYKSGKIAYEQIVMKEGKVLARRFVEKLPILEEDASVVQKTETNAFPAPSFPKMTESFPFLPVETTPSFVTEPTTTTTTTSAPKRLYGKRKLPGYLKMKKSSMHSRQFASKTVEMTPVSLEGTFAEQEVDPAFKKGITIRSLKKVQEEPEDVTEPPKKRRKVKKAKKTEEIRKFTDLYQDEQRQTIVPPSAQRAPEEFSKEVESFVSGRRDQVVTTTHATKVTKKLMRKRRRISRQKCHNIRSFSRQFLFDDVREFAVEHCAFIANYYPELTCDRVDVYMSTCQRYFSSKF